MPRVLVVEDDRETADQILETLRERGFEADWAADGREGLARASSGDYDAVTIDRMLPGMDGLSIIRRLRDAQVDTPVLILSALDEVDERIRGLRAGGDDYLTKPFALEELAARLEVLLRRRAEEARRTKLQVGDLVIDLLTREVRRGDRVIELKPRELALLEYMMRHAGQVLTRAMLFAAVWDYHFDPRTNVIEVHMSHLRRKIDLPGEPPLFHTVRGAGYMLRAPD